MPEEIKEIGHGGDFCEDMALAARAVWAYTASVFLASELAAWFSPVSLMGPIFLICAAGGIIGTLGCFQIVDCPSDVDKLVPKLHPSLKWIEPLLRLLISLLIWLKGKGLLIPMMFIFIFITIVCAFTYAHYRPNNVASAWCAFFAALAWGLSIVGTLLLSPTGMFSGPYWNSWLNFFAASFASLAAGFVVV
jgi:hypothetical protein